MFHRHAPAPVRLCSLCHLPLGNAFMATDSKRSWHYHCVFGLGVTIKRRKT